MTYEDKLKEQKQRYENELEFLLKRGANDEKIVKKLQEVNRKLMQFND